MKEKIDLVELNETIHNEIRVLQNSKLPRKQRRQIKALINTKIRIFNKTVGHTAIRLL